MKPIDRFYFFLKSAITEPNLEPQFKHFYDHNLKTLVKVEASILSNREEEFSGLFKLGNLSLSEKVSFLQDYCQRTPPEVSEVISSFLTKFDDKTEIESVLQEVNKVNHTAAVQLNLDLDAFLINRAREEYKNLDITEDTEVTVITANSEA